MRADAHPGAGARPATNVALPLFRHEFTRSVRGLLGWMAGNAAAILLYLPLYPSIGGSRDMLDYFAAFPPDLVAMLGLDKMGTGAGYTQSAYVALMAFFLFVIAAVSWGSAAIAGDEEAGGLELTLAHAVTRTQVVLERALALTVRLVCLAASGVAIIWAINDASQLALGFGGLVAVSIALVALTLLMGMASVFAGAVTGRRSVATAAGAVVAAVAYILDSAFRTTGVLWLGAISPVTWAFGGDPLSTGLDVTGLAGLLGSAGLLVVGAVIAFNRRDVGMS